jgi:protein-S-isoprenylcysteine O-methyltransferase Ste14
MEKGRKKVSEETSFHQEMTVEVRRGVMSWIIKAAGGLVFFGLLLFLCAGRLEWVWAWVFLCLFAAASVVHVAILIPTNPGLLAERAKGLRVGTKGWDKAIVSLAAGILPMASWIIAALNVRFGWTPPMLLGLQLLGALGFALGWAAVLWATASNPCFDTTVRIREEGGHAVATGGPYRYVRHPGYVGAILYQLATPFLLGSWWALIPMLMSVPLYVLRTALEDRTLQDELEGYGEYSREVRYRLLPGVW